MEDKDKVRFILDKVKEENGHIGIVGPIEFKPHKRGEHPNSKLTDVSIYPDGKLKYSVNGRQKNTPLTITQILPEILDGIFNLVTENKYL